MVLPRRPLPHASICIYNLHLCWRLTCAHCRLVPGCLGEDAVCGTGVARNAGFWGFADRAVSGLSSDSEVQSGLAITSLLLVAAWSRGASKPRKCIYLSQGIRVVRLSPASGWEATCIGAGALPGRGSCGFFVNSPALFCCSYKGSVFIRCCDLQYTNPLKKHK